MKHLFLLVMLNVVLSGCASRSAYLNTHKPLAQVKADKDLCQEVVDAAKLQDDGEKKNIFDECMKKKDYTVVSEGQAEKLQGFKELWINSAVDFKSYEVAFIEKVDLSQVKVRNSHIPDTKVTDEDINDLGDEMLKRFTEALEQVIPVTASRQEAAAKKTLYIKLKLDNISQTNLGLNTALAVAGTLAHLPLPGGPAGTFSFDGEITDCASKQPLITLADEVNADKNSSLVKVENFSQWQRAYNVMDYWADYLAALLAKQRGTEYKSKLKMKIL